MPAPFDLVVAITLGQQDLQVLAVGDRGLVRVSPKKAHVGPLHRAILADPAAFPLWVPPGDAAREDRERGAGFDAGRVTLDPGLRLATAADIPGQTPRDAAAWLTFGLLSSGLGAIRGLKRNVLVLLFHTDRGADGPRAAAEPVAAATRVAEWVRTELAAEVWTVGVLGPGEGLTEQDRAGNKYLRAAAAARIDDALRQAAADCPTGSVRLMTSGGIPELSRLVVESAAFRFAAVEYHNPTEDTAPAPAPPGPPPAEVLNVRRRARDLVLQGRVEAALVLAEGLLPGTTRWQRSLAAAVNYLQGYHDHVRERLDATTTAGAWLAERLDNDPLRCTTVALRGEAALRTGDVCAAAAFTGTFLDVATFDAADRVFGSGGCVDWVNVCIPRGRMATAPADFDAARDNFLAAGVGDLGYRADAYARWVGNPNLRIESAWHRWMLADMMTGKAPGPAAALKALCLAMTRKERGLVPAFFRNQVIHSLPIADRDIDGYRALFVARGLWAEDAAGLSLLRRGTLIEVVLREFREADPHDMFESLLRALAVDIEAN